MTAQYEKAQHIFMRCFACVSSIDMNVKAIDDFTLYVRCMMVSLEQDLLRFYFMLGGKKMGKVVIEFESYSQRIGIMVEGLLISQAFPLAYLISNVVECFFAII